MNPTPPLPAPALGQALPVMAVPAFAGGFGLAGLGQPATLIVPPNVVPRLPGIPTAGRLVEYNEPLGLTAFYQPCMVTPEFFVRQMGKPFPSKFLLTFPSGHKSRFPACQQRWSCLL